MLEIKSVVEVFWTTVSSMLWFFFYLKICNYGFFSSQSCSFCKGAESPYPVCGDQLPPSCLQTWFSLSGKHRAQDPTAWMHVLIRATTRIQAAL